MSNVTISPNMNMPIPVVGTDPGPDWANNLNSSLSILDQHNHTPGYGSLIPPAGLNINSSLTFQNNQATNLQAVNFTAQTSLSTLNALYVSGVDLYFNDGASSSPIRITAGGNVNATASGISSGTATASFVGGVLTVNASSNTPANIQGGSLLLGNNTLNSKYLTLAPPNAMGSNFGLVLPNIPAANSFVTLDTAGNFGTIAQAGQLTHANLSNSAGILGSQLDSAAGIVGSQIATGTITSTNIQDGTITGTDIASGTITGTNISSSATISVANIAASSQLRRNGLEAITSSGNSKLRVVWGACTQAGTYVAGEGFGTSVIFPNDLRITFSSAFSATPTFIFVSSNGFNDGSTVNTAYATINNANSNTATYYFFAIGPT